jgi:hypothetical protein
MPHQMGSDPRAMDRPSPEQAHGPNEGRLNSWKKIAVYLKRDITTVQRWEKREAMPVHRHLHDKMGSDGLRWQSPRCLGQPPSP